MTEPLWLHISDVRDIHKSLIASFGGADGERDENLIEGAIARPQNMHHYENEEDLLVLAIRLGVGLQKTMGSWMGTSARASLQ